MGTMTDKVLCPWCGAEMKPHAMVIYETRNDEHPRYTGECWCTGKCQASGPIMEGDGKKGFATRDEAKNAAYAAALHRYTPEDKKGLYGKYRITKADGTPVNDRCFVLKPDKDPAAVAALQAYAAATDDEQLRNDLYAWVGKPILKPLTLEEVFTLSHDENEILWLEYHDEQAIRKGLCGYYEPEYVLAYSPIQGNKPEVNFYRAGVETENTPDPAVYGIGWRCWERKPTKEEMEAAKWEK